MMDAGRHPLITLFAYSEVEDVKGYVGNFKVRVRRKARYVNEDECTSCGDCVKVCPVVVPDEFQEGLSSRRAIHIPFPQAVPSSYLINMNDCLGVNPIACGKCAEVCDKKCIHYDDMDRFEDISVGTVVVATGMDVYDPTEYDEYGYTRHPDVITSMEFERLISAGGPTEGHFMRPSDRQRPKRIGFIQCVGSRSETRGNPYCSNICCMNTVKDTLLLRDHYPDTECVVFYSDIRAFGKGFEDLYKKSRESGVKYIRGLPGDVVQNNGTLTVVVENTEAGKVERYDLDMVVLSVGVIPRANAGLNKLLTLSRDRSGFYMEAHPKLKPVDATTKGVFYAGCAESPKDVKESVTQAGASAARASIILNSEHITVEAITSRVDEALCTGCNVCVKVCPYSAIIAGAKKGAPVTIIEASCAGCGTCASECKFDAISMRHFSDEAIYAQIDAILESNAKDVLLTFACKWCSYSGGDNAGISRLQFPSHGRLVRTMCSGRVSEDHVLHAFRQGAPMVLVSGCHFADCHYINANRSTVRRVRRLWDYLEKRGIRPERLQLEWISAAEGQKFAEVMRVLEPMRAAVTVEEIEHTKKVLNAEYEKEMAKKTRTPVKTPSLAHA
jgi:heterodisulfide reductase subunit A